MQDELKNPLSSESYLKLQTEVAELKAQLRNTGDILVGAIKRETFLKSEANKLSIELLKHQELINWIDENWDEFPSHDFMGLLKERIEKITT